MCNISKSTYSIVNLKHALLLTTLLVYLSSVLNTTLVYYIASTKLFSLFLFFFFFFFTVLKDILYVFIEGVLVVCILFLLYVCVCLASDEYYYYYHYYFAGKPDPLDQHNNFISYYPSSYTFCSSVSTPRSGGSRVPYPEPIGSTYIAQPPTFSTSNTYSSGYTLRPTGIYHTGVGNSNSESSKFRESLSQNRNSEASKLHESLFQKYNGADYEKNCSDREDY